MVCKLYLLNCLVAAKRNIRGDEFRSSNVEFGFVVKRKEKRKAEKKRKRNKIIYFAIDDDDDDRSRLNF